MKEQELSVGEYLKQNKLAIRRCYNIRSISKFTILETNKSYLMIDKLIDENNIFKIDYSTKEYEEIRVNSDLNIDWGFTYDSTVEFVIRNTYSSQEVNRLHTAYITRNGDNFFKINGSSFESCYAQAKVIIDKYCYNNEQFDNFYSTEFTVYHNNPNFVKRHNFYYKGIEVVLHHKILKDEMLYFIIPVKEEEFDELDIKFDMFYDETKYFKGKYISVIDEALTKRIKYEEPNLEGFIPFFNEEFFEGIDE